jgi:hypothetical protein
MIRAQVVRWFWQPWRLALRGFVCSTWHAWLDAAGPSDAVQSVVTGGGVSHV